MCEWDKTKAKQNQTKHGVSFADTFAVFEDASALTLDQMVSGVVITSASSRRAKQRGLR